jgi:inhibitor of cysteine peptidase
MPVELSDKDAPAPRTLAQGEEVVIRLAENPTTGYRWQLTHSGTGELALLEDRFVPGTGGDAGLGASGDRVLRYQGRKGGEVRVDAVLRRSWDPPEASTQRRQFVIVVG